MAKDVVIITGAGDVFCAGTEGPSVGEGLYGAAVVVAEIPQPVTSLARIATVEVDRTQVLTTAIDQVICSIRAFDHNTAQELATEFSRFDVYHDRAIDVMLGDDYTRGINRGITPRGQLRLETEQGIEIHSASEISLKAVVE